MTVKGEVTTIFPTGHAVGITSEDGVEILLHIGMDTVELKGAGFEAKVKQGDAVAAGDLLVKFNIEEISKAGYSVITPMVITNSKDFSSISFDASDNVEFGQSVGKISR